MKRVYKNNNGFTLIELLVVIAIIGILATVVIVSVSNARVRAVDSSIKANLSQMRAAAELTFDGGFNNVCDPDTESGRLWHEAYEKQTSPGMVFCLDEAGRYQANNGTISSRVGNPTGPDDNNQRWAAMVRLSDGTWFCVDSSGAVTETTGARPIDRNPHDKTC
jgi:prepilin-type N-terminal cleavage/methylation domain-containing protein